MSAPLIVSAELDPALQGRLDALRREHFPPKRLVVGAHLTLFHRLPGEQLDAVLAACAELWPGELAATATAPMKLGKGVAIRVDAPGLKELHAALKERWATWLTPQDQQGLRAHVTIQNKVEPPVAQALHDELAAKWEAQAGAVVALAVWRYVGGPWEPAGRVP